jgi:beta-galactosidase
MTQSQSKIISGVLIMVSKFKIMIGSEWFLLPEPSVDELRQQAKSMVINGQKVARIFLYWNEVLQKYNDTWSFEFFDNVFKIAEEEQLLLTVTLNPATIPRWLRKQEGLPDFGSFANPKMWQRALDYVKRVVERYHASPALHSWILENEPTLRDRPNIHMIKGFREHLLKKYGSIEQFNAEDVRSFYMSFDDIGIINDDGSVELNTYMDHGKGYVFQVEWFDYCSKLLETRMIDVSQVIRSIDSVHPTTSNPTSMIWGPPTHGQNIFRQGEIVDFLGNTSHPAWNSQLPNFRRNDYVSIRADAARSATKDPDEVFWTTELQAGNTVFSGSEQNCSTPSPEELYHWLWEIIGSGGRGIVYWLWRTRIRGWEGLEWGLTDLYGHSSERSELSAKVSSILENNSDLFESLRPAKPDIWLLYSYSSINLAYVEGSQAKDSKRSNEQHSNALFGAYSMLRDSGFTSLFIDESNLERIMALPKDSTLIVPGAYALENETIKALCSFVKDGGTLITDGLFALKDRYGRQKIETMQMVSEIIGACLSDIITTQDAFTLSINGISAPGWFVKNRFRDFTTGMVIGKYDDDGQPAVIENHLGLGKVIHIATKFFEHYAKDRDPSARELINVVLPARQATSLRLCNPEPGLHMKRLVGDKQDVFVIFNHNSTGRIAQIYSPRHAVLHSLDDNTRISIHEGYFSNITLRSMQICIFRVDWIE